MTHQQRPVEPRDLMHWTGYLLRDQHGELRTIDAVGVDSAGTARVFLTGPLDSGLPPGRLTCPAGTPVTVYGPVERS